MYKRQGNDILIKSLIEEGVEYIFGYPGGAALHIYDSIFKQKEMEHILVRHEQGATHAADGYARATGKPGVVLVTSGPGATNAITGIATAFMDSIPMIVISGQVAKHLIGTDAFQETDMIGISRPIVKHSFTVDSAENIPEIVKQAFHIATSGRPGPVVIDVPKDTTAPDKLFEFKYPNDVDIRSYKPPIDPDPRQIERAVDAIIESNKPVIYAGGGAINSNASEELIRLNEILDFPVTNTLMGLGVYPATHKRFLGMLGMHGTYQANMSMHNADLIIAIGARFDDRITNTPKLFAPNAKIIHLDVDYSSVSKIIEANIAVFGQVKNSLLEMIKLLEAKKVQPWVFSTAHPGKVLLTNGQTGEKFDNPVTAITAIHITKALSILVVTANAEQMPKICNAIGLLLNIGSYKTSLRFIKLRPHGQFFQHRSKSCIS